MQSFGSLLLDSLKQFGAPMTNTITLDGRAPREAFAETLFVFADRAVTKKVCGRQDCAGCCGQLGR
jgi:hypothetical protein